MSKQLTVKAPLVIVKMSDGSRQHVYAGAPVPEGVDADHRKQLLEADMVEEKAAPKAASDDDADGGVPAKSASKGDWVTYATDEARGEDRLTEDEANALTKDQLVEKYTS